MRFCDVHIFHVFGCGLTRYAMPQANSDVSNLLLPITQCFSLQALANSNSCRVFVAVCHRPRSIPAIAVCVVA